MIIRLIAIIVLMASPSYAMVVGYSRTFGEAPAACADDFMTDDFSLGSRTTDVTGSGSYWDGETDADGDLNVSSGSFRYQISPWHCPPLTYMTLLWFTMKLERG